MTINPFNKPDNYYRQSREEMVKYIPSHAKRLLDVGCGEGKFGAILKENLSAEVWGIEICQEAAEKALKRIDNVLICDIEKDSVSIPLEYFDCIVFNDVLEHLKDPWLILKRIKRNLKANGCIVSSVPNIRNLKVIKNLLLHNKWEYKNEGILDWTHLRFFTRLSIQNMFETSGYDVIMIEGLGNSFSWKWNVLNKLLMKKIDDMRYVTFACVAKKSGHE